MVGGVADCCRGVCCGVGSVHAVSAFRDAIRPGPFDQFGEDSSIRWMLGRMGGPTHYRCAEFGAGDGVACSVTCALWRNDGWTVDLIEADHERYSHLRRFVTQACDGPGRFMADPARYVHSRTNGGDVAVALASLTAANINDHVTGDYDVVSIDVDGPDYHLWEALECAPRIVLVERNQSVPWWMDVRQEHEADRFGASATSLLKLGERKGYTLIGATGANMFFVRDDAVDAFRDRQSFPDMMAEYEVHESWLTYAATDYEGRMVPFGDRPWPWGFQWEPCETSLLVDRS